MGLAEVLWMLRACGASGGGGSVHLKDSISYSGRLL